MFPGGSVVGAAQLHVGSYTEGRLMSLGTSIFLSAILLGIIALFIATKDRWNWKKIFLWPFAVLFTLAVVIGAGVWVYSLISERPHVQTAFWEIPLEATKSDVKFLKGEPTKLDGENVWVYVTKKGYSNEDFYHVIYFNGDKLRASLYTGPYLGSPGIQGLDIGATQEAILKKFGTPSTISVSEDDLEKIFSFREYNVFFSVRENKAYALGMFNPQFEPMKFKKGKITEAKKK